jgi:hypothetical protein
MQGHANGGRRFPLDLQAIFEELEAGAFTSLEEAQAHLSGRVAEYNATPQAELGGLSPEQMTRLLYGGWDGTGLVRLDSSLPLDDLAGAEILINARRFLGWVDEAGGVKATQGGNLPRRALAELADRLWWEEDLAAALRQRAPTLNEQDLFPLHVLRVVVGLAGLLRKVKGSFRATSRGRALLAPERAGELYALLFRTYFRKFNIGYGDRLPEHRALQDTVAFSFYRLARAADAWTRPEELARTIVLPELAEDLPVDEYGLDRLAWMVEWRILLPLIRFGLLERRELPRVERYRHVWEVRRTPLYARFLRFQFSADR